MIFGRFFGLIDARGGLFVALCLLDAALTKAGLALGMVEANPLMAHIGSSILVKGSLALAIVLLWNRLGRGSSLWYMNFIVFGVVLWNCFLLLIMVSVR